MSLPTLAVDDFFWDVPWGHVPADRLGIITVEPPPYKLGLLGGSSKLAALAAKRRKEREDAEAASAAKANGEADAAIAMLDKLTVKSNDAASTSSGDAERQSRVSRYPVRRRTPSPKPQVPEPTIEEPQAPQPAVIVEQPAQRASASMFASTLCGATSSSPPIFPTFSAINYKDHESLKSFECPSPDDIVRAAQAKGSGGRH